MAEQIKAGLDDFWVTDRYLHTVAQLPFEPGFSLLCGNVRCQYRNANALSCKYRLQATSDVTFLGVHRVYVATPPGFQLCLDDFDQPPLLCLQAFPIQVL